MKKIIIFFLVIAVYGFDTDLDGVEDRNDHCPNTPFWQTVDSNGCAVGRVLPMEMESKLGITYAKIKEVEAKRYFLDTRIYYKTYTLITYFSKMSVEGSTPKSLDAVLSLADTVYEDREIKTKLYATLYLPTHYNKETDYGFKGSCYLKNYDLMLSYRYRQMSEYFNTHTLLTEYYLRYDKNYLAPFVYVESASTDRDVWYLFGGAILHLEHEQTYVDIEAMRVFNRGFGNSYTLTFSIGLRF